MSWEEQKWCVNGYGPCPNEVTGVPFSGKKGHYKRGGGGTPQEAITEPITPKKHIQQPSETPNTIHNLKPHAHLQVCTPYWIFSPPNLSPAIHCHIYLSPILCALVYELFKQEELLIGLLWVVYLSFGLSSSKGKHSHEAYFNGLVRVWSHSSHLFLHKKKAPTFYLRLHWGVGIALFVRCHLTRERLIPDGHKT